LRYSKQYIRLRNNPFAISEFYGTSSAMKDVEALSAAGGLLYYATGGGNACGGGRVRKHLSRNWYVRKE